MLRATFLGGVLGLFAFSPATAQLGFYFGAGLGQSSVETRLDDFELVLDDDDLAYKLFAGLELGRHFAVEASYRDLGDVEETLGEGAAVVSTDGFDAFLLGRATLGPVTLFAKAGLFFWDSSLDVDDLRLDADGEDFAWGLGASVKLLGFGLRLEYEQFDIDAADDLAMVSAGITFGF